MSTLHPDGQNRFYTRDEELHVTADVAYAIVRYADVTGDVDYLYGEGAEILFETTRFWMQRCTRDGDRLVLHTVMGPDEFHSHVDNNAFTNRMVRWHLERAAQVHARMAQTHPDALAALAERIGLAAGEADGWPMPRNRSSHPSTRHRGDRAVRRLFRADRRPDHRMGRERHAPLPRGVRPFHVRGRRYSNSPTS